MDINTIIFNRVQSLCSINNITIYALEKNTGIKHGTIQNWKNAIPSINNLLIVADYFGVSIDYLSGRCENPLSHKDLDTLSTVIAELVQTAQQYGVAAQRIHTNIQQILDNHGIKLNVLEES